MIPIMGPGPDLGVGSLRPLTPIDTRPVISRMLLNRTLKSIITLSKYIRYPEGCYETTVARTERKPHPKLSSPRTNL